MPPAPKSRWDPSRWTIGQVTILQAIGIPWNLHPPKLTASLTEQGAHDIGQGAAAAAASANAGTTGGSGSPATRPGGAPGKPGTTGSVGGNVTAPASQSQSDWAKSVLNGLGAPATAANINSLIAWTRHESPWNASPPDGALYTNNPLNTTISGFNTVGSVNSVGVKRYATPRDGVSATIATLNGGYPAIVSRLRSGQGLCGFSSAEFSKWSGGGYSSVC